MGIGKRIRKLLRFFSPLQEGIVRTTEYGAVEVEDRVASTAVSLPGHFLLAFLFSGSVLAYFIFALVMFFTQPDEETFSQALMTSLPNKDIRVRVSCSNPPNCGTLSILQNYTGVARCATAPTIAGSAFNGLRSLSPTDDTVTATLCPLDDFVFSVASNTAPLVVPGLAVEFSAVNPGFNTTTATSDPLLQAHGIVTVFDATTDAVIRSVNLDTWQVKTLMLGRSQAVVHGVTTSDQLTATGVQYEGKRPNWRATLLIRLEPYALVQRCERPGTIVDVLASVGGAVSLISTFLLLTGPLVRVFLPGHVDSVEDIPTDSAVLRAGKVRYDEKRDSDRQSSQQVELSFSGHSRSAGGEDMQMAEIDDDGGRR